MDELDPDREAKPVVAEVGRALRTARRRRGLSQRELARKIGVSKSRLARLESDAGPQSLELCDASGRRFPAHLDAYRLAYPPTYWFVRNGGWTTSRAFPQWTFERRFSPGRETWS
jgi:transcriptional regulator with XRE-family HTH domain